jgi:hypothetical protein
MTGSWCVVLHHFVPPVVTILRTFLQKVLMLQMKIYVFKYPNSIGIERSKSNWIFMRIQLCLDHYVENLYDTKILISLLISWSGMRLSPYGGGPLFGLFTSPRWWMWRSPWTVWHVKPHTVFSIINPTWPHLEPRPPATNRLNYDTAATKILGLKPMASHLKLQFSAMRLSKCKTIIPSSTLLINFVIFSRNHKELLPIWEIWMISRGP